MTAEYMGNPMDAKLKAKWVRALRSGKFKQAKGTLKNAKGAMCCLGVLCHIQGVDLDAMSKDERITCCLPRGKNAGLSKDTRSILAAKNDGSYCTENGEGYARCTFKKIAKYIEAEL